MLPCTTPSPRLPSPVKASISGNRKCPKTWQSASERASISEIGRLKLAFCLRPHLDSIAGGGLTAGRGCPAPHGSGWKHLSQKLARLGYQHTAGSHRKPIVGPRHTVTMGNHFSADISATGGARGLKFGPHATNASPPPLSTPAVAG